MLKIIFILLLLFLIIYNLQLRENFDNNIESELNNYYDMVSKNIDKLDKLFLSTKEQINKSSKEVKNYNLKQQKISKNKYTNKKNLNSFLQGSGLLNNN
tara:strand:- start:452 stop:748 length:297 start_codon:yes stop_codon:yes gene_type:complete